MIVTHKISMDLARPGLHCIEAVQDDRYSRDIQFRLTANGLPFQLPEDCVVEVGFTKSDGRSGRYDTMPDGTPAYQLSGDLLTVRLAPQVLTAAGEVSLWVRLSRHDAQLSGFPLRLIVHERPDFSAASEDYVNITRFLPQPDRAEVGKFLLVEAVDEQGRVSAVCCADAAQPGSGTGGYYTPNMQSADGKMVISYTPSQDTMPSVPSQTVALPRGKDGMPGVYLGDQEPTAPEVMVWIDPDGGLSGILPVERVDSMTLDVGVDADGRLYVDAYNKAAVDQALGAYIADVDALIGGDG